MHGEAPSPWASTDPGCCGCWPLQVLSACTSLRLFLYISPSHTVPDFSVVPFSHLVRKDTLRLPPNEGFLVSFDGLSSGLPTGLSSLFSPFAGAPHCPEWAQVTFRHVLALLLLGHPSPLMFHCPPSSIWGIGLNLVYEKRVSTKTGWEKASPSNTGDFDRILKMFQYLCGHGFNSSCEEKGWISHSRGWTEGFCLSGDLYAFGYYILLVNFINPCMFLNCAAWILLTYGAVDPQLIDTASHTASLRTSGGTAPGAAWLTATFLPRLAPTETQTAATHAALASLVPRTRCGDGNSARLCRALPKGRVLLPCHRWFGVPR